MATQAAPGRARRTFWFDPRFAIGILLVAASVGGVYAVVSAADHTTTVYAASSALTAGQRVTASDLDRTEVRLGALDKRYLSVDRLPEDGLVVTRAIAPGELVPLSAVGTVDSATTASVVLSVQGVLAASIVPGAVVDVWSASKLEHGSYGAPTVLAGSSTVVRLITDKGMVSTSDSASLEVRVPKSKIAAVLQAQANGDVISVVAVSTPLGH